MRVLYVIDSLGTGGAETLLCNLANNLSTRDHLEVHIVTLFSQWDEHWRLAGQRIHVSSLEMRGKTDLVRGVRRLRKLIRQIIPDIIHVHLFPADVVTSLAVGRMGIPVVFTEHSEWNRRRSHPAFRLLDRWTYGHFAKIVCVSDGVRETLIRWVPEVNHRTVVLRNGVEIPSESWHGDGPFESDLLFVGRLVEAKGLDVLLEALHHLREQGFKPSLRVVGDGPLRHTWEEKAIQMGLGGQVIFIGRTKNVQALMRSSRVFVLSSRWEGLPMVLLEAMSLGMPIVATKVAGVSEVLTSDTGFIVDPGDAHQLASAVELILADESQSSGMGNSARERASNRFAMKVYADRLVALYQEAVQGGPAWWR